MKRRILLFSAVGLVLIVGLLVYFLTRECEHEYTEEVTRKATCTAEGVLTKTCVRCDETLEEPIPLLPHTFGNESLTREPTCKDEGAVYTACVDCGAENITETIPKTDEHTFVNKVLRAPTCADTGEGADVCSLCGYSVPCTYELTSHAYGSGTVMVSPTCSQEGSRQYTCATCGHSTSESISKLDHTWDAVSCSSPVNCTVCGYTASNGLGHDYYVSESFYNNHSWDCDWYMCSRCGHEKKVYTDEFNPDQWEREISNYAASKGFHVIYSNERTTDSGRQYPVMPMNTVGDDILLRESKESIDYRYNDIINAGKNPRNCTYWVVIEYDESSLYGGAFSIYHNFTW